MRRISKDSYNWAAGSYVDLFFISAITQIFFAVGLYWIFVGDSDFLNELLEVQSNAIMLSIGTLVIMGWAMALILGIGFDRFPLDYKNAPFDPSIISTTAALNISGQVLILVGILTSQIESLETLAQMGATLLGMQMILLGPTAWRLSKTRSKEHNVKVGMWNIGVMLTLPVIGVITILAWIFINNELFQILFWTAIFDGFWLMVTFALFLAHFNDRLGWNIMSSKASNSAFTVFVVLVIIHIILQFLHHIEYITDSIVKASISAPILWIFFVSKPSQIWKNVFAGKSCSAQILSGHSWLLATAAIGIYEAVVIEESIGMYYTRFMLIFGVVVQAVWGSSVWLHEDHKFTKLEDRKTRWVSVIMMNTLMFGIISLALHEGGHIELNNLGIVLAISVVALLIAASEFFLWLVTDAISNHDNWNRIPMFYANMDNAHELDDAYFPCEE